MCHLAHLRLYNVPLISGIKRTQTESARAKASKDAITNRTQSMQLHAMCGMQTSIILFYFPYGPVIFSACPPPRAVANVCVIYAGTAAMSAAMLI